MNASFSPDCSTAGPAPCLGKQLGMSPDTQMGDLEEGKAYQLWTGAAVAFVAIGE